MPNRIFQVLVGAVLLVLFWLVIEFNVIFIQHAYSGRPLYFSHNSDKPMDAGQVLPVDGAMLVAIGAYLYWIRRRRELGR
jgi:hypothetical protein